METFKNVLEDQSLQHAHFLVIVVDRSVSWIEICIQFRYFDL